MKLSDVESKQLLPRFAVNISWVMDALDSIIKPISQRVKSIDAPLTMESIEACTDAELEALYDQYGVAKYYPDLSRETRNKMLYEMCRIYRYLGTPKAIEVLCNYIFDGVQLNVKVEDNLAFDEHGDLVDESLLDVFDVDVNPTEPIFGADVNARIIANIIRFSRNSQALRSIVYTFIQDFALSVSPCKRTGNPQSTQTWPQDSLCVPYTPPTPAYTEITLYLADGSGNKTVQRGVTSGYTSNVVSGFCHNLYVDAACTAHWSGYDYSDDYEIGYYADGEFVRYPCQNILDLPDAITYEASEAKVALILLDTGYLWLCSNYTTAYNQSVVLSQITLRIYHKAQQYYAFYKGSTSNSYENGSLSNGNISGLKGKPYISNVTQQTVPWGVQDNTLPVRTLQKVLGSAGNELSLTGLDWRDPSLGYNFYQLANNSGSSISYRSVIFTLSVPTETGYTNLAGANDSVGTTAVPLYKKTGGKVDYDPAYSYRVIGIFKANGDAANSAWSNVNNLVLEDDGYGKMTVRRSSGSGISLNKVWYTKTIKPIETTFGAAVTIPMGYEVESVTCSRGYAFASNVSSESSIMGNFVKYEFSGEKTYFDDTNTALVGVGVVPALQIFAITNLQQQGYYLSTKSGSTQNYLSTAAASELNSNGYFVKGTTNYNDSNIMNTIVNALQTYFPVYFNLSDSSGNWLYFCFRVPQTLWQVQNGVFSWLGDTTDLSDLAYWYNGRAVRINLRPIT